MGSLTVAGNLGFLFREIVPSRTVGLAVEHEVIVRLGTSYDLRQRTGAPVHPGSHRGIYPAQRSLGRQQYRGLRVVGGIGFDITDRFNILLAGGTAIAGAYSIPDYRGIVTLSYSERFSDRDNDLVEDSDDRCPVVAEDRDGFEDTDGCPDEDNDKDFLLDAEDSALCPDRDKDGLLDGKDKCPDEAEDNDGFEDDDGCPTSTMTAMGSPTRPMLHPTTRQRWLSRRAARQILTTTTVSPMLSIKRPTPLKTSMVFKTRMAFQISTTMAMVFLTRRR
ncbi:MAG: hypothetical protein R3C68_17830 [Myxococcota bacterium]